MGKHPEQSEDAQGVISSHALRITTLQHDLDVLTDLAADRRPPSDRIKKINDDKVAAGRIATAAATAAAVKKAAVKKAAADERTARAAVAAAKKAVKKPAAKKARSEYPAKVVQPKRPTAKMSVRDIRRPPPRN